MANGYAGLSDRGIKECIVAAACAGGGGGGGGGSGQLKYYTTTDPNTDGILPDDQTKPALAFKADGTGSTYVWDTVGLTWN